MEFLVSVIVNAIWIAFWFWVGTKIVERLKSLKEKDNLLSKEAIVLNQIKKIPTLKTEIHGEIIFAFNTGDDTFVAQGASIDEVAEVAYKYKKIDLAYVIHNEQPMWFMNGKVTTTDVKLT
jgi:hypothetical protein